MTGLAPSCCTRSEAETESLGAAVGTVLCAGDVLALTGALGAGKTRFVRGVARGLGVDPALVSSPTFVLMQEYPVEPARHGIAAIVHIDAYRLGAGDGLASVGVEPIRDPDAVTLIEWADRLTDDLPPEALTVSISHGTARDERGVTVTGADLWRERFDALQWKP